MHCEVRHVGQLAGLIRRMHIAYSEYNSVNILTVSSVMTWSVMKSRGSFYNMLVLILWLDELVLILPRLSWIFLQLQVDASEWVVYFVNVVHIWAICAIDRSCTALLVDRSPVQQSSDCATIDRSRMPSPVLSAVVLVLHAQTVAPSPQLWLAVV